MDSRLYRDQLTLTERHLDGLIDDANATLKLLTSLSHSFQSVEAQTSTFQSQCEDLLKEQRRLEDLADDVGTDLHYYAYLDNATRRLNAPGASRLVDDDSFGEMIENIDACIVFMEKHVSISGLLNMRRVTHGSRKRTAIVTPTLPDTTLSSQRLYMFSSTDTRRVWKGCPPIFLDKLLRQNPIRHAMPLPMVVSRR